VCMGWRWATRTLNDHEQLRNDPLLALLAGRRELDRPLAGKSTLNRLELCGRSEALSQDRAMRPRRSTSCWGTYFWRRTPNPQADRARPGMRPTSRVYGHQPERFFPWLLRRLLLPAALYLLPATICCARRLRPGQPRRGPQERVDEVARIVQQVRQRWPEVEDCVCAPDSGSAARS